MNSDFDSVVSGSDDAEQCVFIGDSKSDSDSTYSSLNFSGDHPTKTLTEVLALEYQRNMLRLFQLRRHVNKAILEDFNLEFHPEVVNCTDKHLLPDMVFEILKQANDEFVRREYRSKSSAGQVFNKSSLFFVDVNSIANLEIKFTVIDHFNTEVHTYLDRLFGAKITRDSLAVFNQKIDVFIQHHTKLLSAYEIVISSDQNRGLYIPTIPNRHPPKPPGPFIINGSQSPGPNRTPTKAADKSPNKSPNKSPTKSPQVSSKFQFLKLSKHSRTNSADLHISSPIMTRELRNKSTPKKSTSYTALGDTLYPKCINELYITIHTLTKHYEILRALFPDSDLVVYGETSEYLKFQQIKMLLRFTSRCLMKFIVTDFGFLLAQFLETLDSYIATLVVPGSNV
ncbi:Hypothetical protein PP7435_CHR1-0149 [Komagataella phaffii CBS 7435]|uniref:Uncharacterized protein n=2 Tax=Komagataella phaffii TaxID=460519 RepID=C4QVD3_KOMPG|nr:Hypothetical protein PAS_chr1-3_0146 [Komagataella phaffii GS115]AOA61112.1 GQ67_02400T0 [Komagataella phaffii]CAH2445861.1 Hypothetical protein BQ9382_C1-0780 [Komagataella phaffii CBS 7435]AOA66151.1 GQ68_02847T0 [Komagataella phaffii GS115]CAY67206.1 Hypothetical protein PAS_chr1-3_0146 [Komagataella phaffii GS115]CCA36315.1 Hypothetical protein PP7435_CHR1-0149 [Komagataella phaffii CBS 7435]